MDENDLLTVHLVFTTWFMHHPMFDVHMLIQGPHWNPHGCCVNHWYRVPIKIDPNACEDKCGITEGCFENKPSGGKFKTEFNNMKSCDE